MDTITKRSLQIFAYALENNLAGSSAELCKEIGLVPSNLSQIKTGLRSFTHSQLQKLAELTRVNMNWIYGFSQQKFRDKNEKGEDLPAVPPMDRIRQALKELEKELGKGKKKE